MAEVPIMVMPWHRPDPCKPLKMQTDAAFKASYLDYLSTLRLDSPPLNVPLTTIMGTIGPSSDNIDIMVDLMEQGMSIALVPLAIGVRQDHLDTIANIRAANSAFNNMRNMVYPLGIAVQTKGPGLRLGGLLKDLPVTLALHQKVTLTNDKAWRTKGTEHYLYINFPEMCHVLTDGDILLVGGGTVILQVEYIDQKEVKCVVAGGGLIQSFTSVSVPDVPLNLPPLTDEDVDDLQMAASMAVDIVVVSHTQTADLIKDIRKILDEENGGSGIKVWAQVESSLALQNLESILEVADAVVFSRITLLQDIPVEKLFLAQKIALSTCNAAGVPVFVTSYFLPSMQVANTPSVAEVIDVATAILDGVDGFLMRNTTSHGKHPELAVRTMIGACLEAEAAVWHHQTFSYLNSHAPPPIDPTHSIAIAAVEASLKASASVILLATTSGRSAQLVARYRPRCPIVAVTRYGQVARQLNSWRAIIPLHYIDPPLPEWTREVDVRIQFGIEFAKHKGIVHPGDVMVLLNGWRQGAGFTNTIRIVYASESFPWVYPHKLPSNIPSDNVVDEQEGDIPVEDMFKSSGTGEPGSTYSRSPTAQNSPSVLSPGLSSKIQSMQEEFRSVASLKAKEMTEALVESIQSIKSGPSQVPRKSLNGTYISEKEHMIRRSQGSTSNRVSAEFSMDTDPTQSRLTKRESADKQSVSLNHSPRHSTEVRKYSVTSSVKTQKVSDKADVQSEEIKSENYEEQEDAVKTDSQI